MIRLKFRSSGVECVKVELVAEIFIFIFRRLKGKIEVMKEQWV